MSVIGQCRGGLEAVCDWRLNVFKHVGWGRGVLFGDNVCTYVCSSLCNGNSCEAVYMCVFGFCVCGSVWGCLEDVCVGVFGGCVGGGVWRMCGLGCLVEGYFHEGSVCVCSGVLL